MKCHICNNQLEENTKFCSLCGTKVITEVNNSLTPHCPVCNSEVEKDNKFCHSCGTNLDDPSVSAVNHHNYKYKQHLPKSKGHSLGLSISALVIALTVGSMFPILLMILPVVAVAVAIINFRKIKTRKSGWALALASLAFLVGSFNLVSDLVERNYAIQRIEEIQEIIDFNLPNKKPAFYNISFIDDELRRVYPYEYDFNEIILQLTPEETTSFATIVSSNPKFNSENFDFVTTNLKQLVQDGIVVSLIYDITTDSFNLPTNINDYDLLIINFYLEDGVIQILEVKTK